MGDHKRHQVVLICVKKLKFLKRNFISKLIDMKIQAALLVAIISVIISQSNGYPADNGNIPAIQEGNIGDTYAVQEGNNQTVVASDYGGPIMQLIQRLYKRGLCCNGKGDDAKAKE